ncbi:hypothetical protein QJQ45_017647 [Haematococcus lacustris]|nr:hypothetical protein QJQ45_017647 [Haematococcus lacustris]
MTKGQQGCIKTTATVGTDDGWKLWLVRTQARTQQAQRTYPVMLVPGLGSSGAYTFDLSPQVSFAEYLALQGWDVWTVELRGNGHSDKPSLLSSRSRWLTIDHYVERDLPALLRHVCMQTGCSAVHCVGHSMGGMVLTGVLARGDATSRRMRSVTLIGSSCFLEGSWWEAVKPTMAVAPLLYSVPAGATMRLYSNLAFTRLAVPALDILYFWPTNTDPALARAVLARNFSSISPGVVLQFRSAFKPSGLRSARAPDHPAFADPARLAAGARKQFEMLGSPHKKLIILGPASGQSSHMGHFDILMGKRATVEVFPCLHAWLEEHDHVMDLDTATMQPVAIPSAEQQPASPCPTDPPPPLHQQPYPRGTPPTFTATEQAP